MLLVSHDRALLDAVAERTLAIEDGTIRSYDGGWADYVRTSPLWTKSSTSSGPAPSETEVRPAPRIVRKEREKPKGPSELEQVETAIQRQEATVAELERKLADDGWDDMDLLTAHRAARDELQSLLDRWETLFEQAQA